MVLFPPGRRASSDDVIVAVIHLVGFVAGGFSIAVAFWIVSGLLEPIPHVVRMVAFVIVTAVLCIGSATLGPRALPANRRQIPPEVLMGRGGMGVFQFGFEIGTGMRTFLPTAAPHVV